MAEIDQEPKFLSQQEPWSIPVVRVPVKFGRNPDQFWMGLQQHPRRDSGGILTWILSFYPNGIPPRIPPIVHLGMFVFKSSTYFTEGGQLLLEGGPYQFLSKHQLQQKMLSAFVICWNVLEASWSNSTDQTSVGGGLNAFYRSNLSC